MEPASSPSIVVSALPFAFRLSNSGLPQSGHRRNQQRCDRAMEGDRYVQAHKSTARAATIHAYGSREGRRRSTENRDDITYVRIDNPLAKTFYDNFSISSDLLSALIICAICAFEIKFNYGNSTRRQQIIQTCNKATNR